MFPKHLHLFVLGAVVSTVLALSTHVKRGIVEDLGPLLSDSAYINTNLSAAPRWSDWKAPVPGYIVHVAEEIDVAVTASLPLYYDVQYCNEHDLQFLAQSGGHGWADTFTLGANDVIIDMRGLNSISFNEEGDQVTVGGGVLNGELISAASERGVQVLNGGCNCVGVLGLTLGGGLSRWMNLYGMPIDNVVSVNLVNASGDLITVSKDSYPDLFWAILGAGPNFGIVTSVVLKSYPLLARNGAVWTGELLFSGDKLPAIIDALNNLNITEETNILWGFSHRPDPVITAQLFHILPDPEAGRAAFKSLYDIGPDSDTTGIVNYININDDTDVLCADGGRKPGWFTGLKKFDYETFQQIWDLYVQFVAETRLADTTILVECYSNYALRAVDRSTTAYAHRDIEYHAWQIVFYNDTALDTVVEEYGRKVRELWRGTSGFEVQRTYINFAHGGESLEEIYGESLPRLRVLKGEWDPERRFNQWFPIK